MEKNTKKVTVKAIMESAKGVLLEKMVQGASAEEILNMVYAIREIERFEKKID